MWLARQVNRFYILKNPSHRVGKIEISGNIAEVKALRDAGARLLFVANHPSHSDPQFMIEIQRRLGIRSFFMAAYDVFLRGERQAWLMQKIGSFSIDREANDRKAMTAAIDVLKEGSHALTIFPEGNVYLMNDRVTPFLDGTSFIALKAHQALKGEGKVWLVPISLKFSQLEDIKEATWQRLKQLAKDSGYEGVLDPSDPENEVIKIGSHLLTGFLREHIEFSGNFDFSGLTPDELKDRLYVLVQKLAGDLENDLDLERNEETFIVDRVRKVRSRIHQIKIDPTALANFGEGEIQQFDRRAMLSFRILAYVLPYLMEHKTLDRYAETVERLCEDFYFRGVPPLGPRKAMARVGSPISLQKIVNRSGGNSRIIVPELTQLIEKTIQFGIDQLNAENTAVGGKRISSI